jgi:triacylglycerol esterase/lipase EstA (alpha/beta hydrolase family)
MAKSRVHLIVLVHGLYGNPDNLAVVKEELERAAKSRSKGKGREVDEEEDIVESLLDPPTTSFSSPSSSTSQITRDGLELHILVCKSFTGSHTWDGIDVNAHRAAKEIDTEIERLEKDGKVVEVFSVVCRRTIVQCCDC